MRALLAEFRATFGTRRLVTELVAGPLVVAAVAVVLAGLWVVAP